jgi:hypothetical protein
MIKFMTNIYDKASPLSRLEEEELNELASETIKKEAREQRKEIHYIITGNKQQIEKDSFVDKFGKNCANPISAIDLEQFIKIDCVENLNKLDTLKSNLDNIMNLCVEFSPKLRLISASNEGYGIIATIKNRYVPQEKIISFCAYFRYAIRILEMINYIINNSKKDFWDAEKLEYTIDWYKQPSNIAFTTIDLPNWKNSFELINDFKITKAVKFGDLPEYSSKLLAQLEYISYKLNRLH